MKKGKIMVSIIIPVYNCEKYIEKCINSIINQTYKDFEVIIVDDGSIDNSIEICNKLIKTDKRFKITRQTNQGVSCARNQGLELAKGEYITFIDSDDWVENTFIECLLKGILEEQADMSVCGIVRESLKNVVIGKEKYPQKVLNNKEAMSSALRMDGFQGYLCNKMFCRNLIENNKLRLDSEITILEDLLFVVQYLNGADKIVTVPQATYHYIVHDDSARQACSKGESFNIKWLTEIKALSKIINYVKYDELKNYAKARKVLSCGFYLKRMYECEYHNKKVEKRLKKYIRQHLHILWKNDAGNFKWKLTTTICGFSPKCENCIHNIIKGSR